MSFVCDTNLFINRLLGRTTVGELVAILDKFMYLIARFLQGKVMYLTGQNYIVELRASTLKKPLCRVGTEIASTILETVSD